MSSVRYSTASMPEDGWDPLGGVVTAGVPLTEVRDLLGHSTVMMTERYAHLAPENVREAVRKLEGLSRSGHADDQATVVKSL